MACVQGMNSKGQTAMDIVMALVVLLVVMSIFSNIQSQFSLTQKEITLRQQLRANAISAAQFVTQAAWYEHADPAGGTNIINNFSSFSGQSAISPIRAFGKLQGFDCSATTTTVNANEIAFELLLLKTDTGLSQNISEKSIMVHPTNFLIDISDPAVSKVIFNSCFEPVVVQ